jgi:hypothetical protein
MCVPSDFRNCRRSLRRGALRESETKKVCPTTSGAHPCCWLLPYAGWAYINPSLASVPLPSSTIVSLFLSKSGRRPCMASGLLCFLLQKYCWRITCAVSLGPTLNLNIWMCTASALENAEGGCRALFCQKVETRTPCSLEVSALSTALKIKECCTHCLATNLSCVRFWRREVLQAFLSVARNLYIDPRLPRWYVLLLHSTVFCCFLFPKEMRGAIMISGVLLA